MKKLMNKIKTMVKILKAEIKEIKWVPSKDISRQTFFSFGAITISMAIFMAFDTGIQMLLSLIIK